MVAVEVYGAHCRYYRTETRPWPWPQTACSVRGETMIAEITTISLDEATVVDAARRVGVIDRKNRVKVVRKPCSPKALFEFPDTPEIRELLDRYNRRELLPIPARVLMIARADLYREARAARGGL